MPRRPPIRAIKQLSKYGNKSFKAIIAIFLFGFSAGIAWEEFIGIGTWHSYHTPTNKINVCFTPATSCANLIALEIFKAKKSIHIQAYGFTNKTIIRQLIDAHNRGIKVVALVDRSNLTDKYSEVNTLKQAGIEIAVDKVPGIAHNKVMIIDQQKVITGSFNFTNAADKSNAENVVLIEDPLVAQLYLRNWLDRKANDSPVS